MADPSPREALLATTFVQLTDTLVTDFDVVELLTLLADRCVEVLGVGAAGLMLVGPDGDLRVMASSSEAMCGLELFELQSREGPCLDCYHTGQPVFEVDLAANGHRWPRFAAEALGAGFRSVDALPMRLRGKVIGALNLFQVRPGPMVQADVDAAQSLAGRHHRHTRAPRRVRDPGPERAAPTRPQQPHRHRAGKGIVAERKGLSMEAAFNALRNHATFRTGSPGPEPAPGRSATLARSTLETDLLSTQPGGMGHIGRDPPLWQRTVQHTPGPVSAATRPPGACTRPTPLRRPTEFGSRGRPVRSSAAVSWPLPG